MVLIMINSLSIDLFQDNLNQEENNID
jgi:hypothetical protein